MHLEAIELLELEKELRPNGCNNFHIKNHGKDGVKATMVAYSWDDLQSAAKQLTEYLLSMGYHIILYDTSQKNPSGYYESGWIWFTK